MFDDRDLRRLAWVRQRWRHRRPSDTARALDRVAARRPDPTTPVWQALLTTGHPFAAWLDADLDPRAMPCDFDGVTPRQILASHPFPEVVPWSSPPTSPASSSTPRG